MMKKFIPFSVLALLVLAACGPTNSDPTFTFENPQSGLGNYELKSVSDKDYELTVEPINTVTVKEIKVNGQTLSANTEGKYTFTAKGGENIVSISYNTPTLNEAFVESLVNNHINNKQVVGLDYIYRTLYINTFTNEIDTDIYKKYDANFYTNGAYADVTIATTGNAKLTSEEGFATQEVTGGMFVTYKVDEESYYRALVPETYHEEGFAEVLERNAFFDETSEDLGYIDYVNSILPNYAGEYQFPEGYGYVNAFEVSSTDTTKTFTIEAVADMADYGDGYIVGAENHNINITVDSVSYELTSVTYDGRVYLTDFSSPVVTVYETKYENITVGELEEGQIPAITSTDTIDPKYVTIEKPSIQSDIADGELSKDDASRVLDNIWAYSTNTKQTTSHGEAIMYDYDYNEISGTSNLTITAYKDYFLVNENEFTPDDTETYGGKATYTTQKYVTSDGVANVSAVDGVVDPYSSYTDQVTAQYNFKENFSASPLTHDFTMKMVVQEAVEYNFTTHIEEFEWGGAYGLVYDNYSATKDGDDITIRWSVAITYGEDGTEAPTYYQIVIEDNFVTSMSYGPSFEDCLTYHMIQGEYEEYTGEIYEFVDPYAF